MSGLLIAITVIFFAVGITFGVITTLAVSTVRANRRARPDYGFQFEPQDEAEREGGPWSQPATGSGWDEDARDDRPRWPGGADTAFRNGWPLTGAMRR
jgi:hypothetical protein